MVTVTSKTSNEVACTSSTLPESGAAGTENVLPGPSSGNSNDANSTNHNKNTAVLGGVVAHIEIEKKTVSMLTIYFLSSSGANFSDFKYFVFDNFVFRMLNQLQQKAPA